jgi:hypothetical protein
VVVPSGLFQNSHAWLVVLPPAHWGSLGVATQGGVKTGMAKADTDIATTRAKPSKRIGPGEMRGEFFMGYSPISVG